MDALPSGYVMPLPGDQEVFTGHIYASAPQSVDQRRSERGGSSSGSSARDGAEERDVHNNVTPYCCDHETAQRRHDQLVDMLLTNGRDARPERWLRAS